MAFQFKAPPVTSTVAAPYVPMPESAYSHAGTIGLLSGLNALGEVAGAYRDHQNATAQANAFADVLDSQGMKAEADLYRASAKSFKLNFFSNPGTASQAREKMLSDALNLLTKNRERATKEEIAGLKDQMNQQGTWYQQQTIDLRREQQLADLKSQEARLQQAADRAANESEKLDLRRQMAEKQAEIDQFNADTRRMQAEADIKLRAAQEENTKLKSAKLVRDAEGIGSVALNDRLAAARALAANNGMEVASFNEDGTFTLKQKDGREGPKGTFEQDGLGGWKVKFTNLSVDEARGMQDQRSQAPMVTPGVEPSPAPQSSGPPVFNARDYTKRALEPLSSSWLK